MTTAEIERWISNHQGVHEKEIGFRVGESRKLLKEIVRLRSGDFTPEEFQFLCHKFSEQDREAFFAGCAAYQRKLFSKADIDRFP